MLGNIIGIIDKTGKLMIKFSYTAFGVPIINYSAALSQEELLIAQDIVLNNVFLYKGYIYDGECAMYWLSSRFYVPELGRFLTPDDIEYLDSESINGLNLYCYCLNNPVMYVDPSGHFTLLSVGISLGFALLFEFIDDMSSDGKIGGDKDGWDYFGAFVSGLLGGMEGTAGIFLGIFGDLFDSMISGDIHAEGTISTLLNIGISALVSVGIEFFVKRFINYTQIKRLKPVVNLDKKITSSNLHSNKKLVESLGVSYSFSKNGKSKNSFINAIVKNNWNIKRYTSQAFSEVGSSLFSLFFNVKDLGI